MKNVVAAVNEYFLGEEASGADRVWFFGTLGVATAMAVVIGMIVLLNG